MTPTVPSPASLAPEGELALTSELQACFSGQTVELRLTWTEDRASLAVGPDEWSLPRTRVLSLVEQILAAAHRPEVLCDARSTTNYQASLRWCLRASGPQGWSTGEATFVSSDMPREMGAQIVARRPDLAARIPTDLYARAIALHELAVAIADEAST